MNELDKTFFDGDVSLNLELIKVHLGYLSKLSDQTDSVISEVVSENVDAALERLAKLESLIEVMQDA
jgi:hypothetical protein